MLLNAPSPYFGLCTSHIFHCISAYPELASIQLTRNYIDTELRSTHPGLNAVYPQFNAAANKTNLYTNKKSCDDDEYKDEDDDVNDNHSHIDILFVKRCGIRRI